MARICLVEGCRKLSHAKGYCSGHSYRLRRYGNPLGGRPATWGEPERFYQEVVLTCERGENDPCLIWPFARLDYGYAIMRAGDGDSRLVHRRLCEETKGPPPTPDHQAAHNCGKGHLACVTKGHLRWATRQENMDDQLIHGTRPKRAA